MPLFPTPMRGVLAAAFAVLAVGFTSPASAVVVTRTPADINLGNTATTSYTDGKMTLTPFIGATPATFNANATRLGIDDQAGTNANAFNDIDTDPNNGNEEKLRFQFANGSGLTQITYDFARADGSGPFDGVFISGFIADPGVTFARLTGTGSIAAITSSFDSNTGTLEIDLPGSLFIGDDIAINLNPAASNGRTLLLSATDTTQAGAQLPITSISYDDAAPFLGVPGDVNGDGLVTVADFNIIRDNFYLSPATRAQGDLNSNGVVSIADFNQWKDEFPGNGAAFASQLSIPEPASAALLALGVLALGGRRRK